MKTERNEIPAMQAAAENAALGRTVIEKIKARRKVFATLVLLSVGAYALFIILLPFGVIPARAVLPLLALFTAELVILWSIMKLLDRRDEHR